MWIIVDKRIPEAAKNALSAYGSLLELESHHVVYDAISGHPDIFLCQFGNTIVFAPNAPRNVVDQVFKRKKFGIRGKLPLGIKYPETAWYNAVITDRFLIHNKNYTDKGILNTFPDRVVIHTPQAYTRCNLIALDDSHYITSDKGIAKLLLRNEVKVLYVSPQGIKLKGFRNGFFGGCCGVYNNTLFINGSLTHFWYGDYVKEFVAEAGFSIIELYDGPLFDGGGIFFINP